MSYSDLYLKQHSRPSQILVALAVFATVSAVGYYFLSSSTPTRASKQVINQHEQVNIFPRQASVFWEVETADEGWVIYGENPSDLNQIALDERDIQERLERKFHYAVLKNLNPETTYYYKIVSNNELVTADGNEPFSIKTISDGTPSSSLSPAYGKVVMQSGDPLSDGIVVLSVTNAHPLVAITKSTGEWLIPLQYVVNKNTLSSIPVTEDTIVNLRILNETQQSNVKATLSQTHPIPQSVIIGNNYTFIEDNVLGETNTTSQASSNSFQVALQFPKNGAVIPGSTPIVKGKGIPGKQVLVQINSRPAFNASARVDKEGNWNVTVNRTLLPGTYTISMTTQDSRNKNVEIKRNFTIIKSGEQVLSESTGSATITPSVSPSASPTTSTSVTPSPTLAVTQVPTPTDQVLVTDLSPTLTPAPPVSGISVIPFMFAGVGLVLLGAGLVLFL